MNPFRNTVQTTPFISQDRVDSLLCYLKHRHPILCFANVHVSAELVGEGVLLILQRNGHRDERHWFRSTATIEEIGDWCSQALDNLCVYAETVGFRLPVGPGEMG
jgi:hypothetical protein